MSLAGDMSNRERKLLLLLLQIACTFTLYFQIINDKSFWLTEKRQQQLLASQMETVFLILRKLLGIYAILLVVFGTIFSLLCCYISFKLRKTTTFIFICFMSLANMFTLYFWNLGNFLRELFQIDLINISLWLCKFGSFFQFTSLQISAWILVKNI